MGRVSFQNRVLLAFGTALAFLAGVGVLAYQRLLQESVDQNWVEHTHLVLEELESARANLTDQETSEQEYQISNDKSFADQFQNAAGRLQSDLSELRSLTSDNPKQQNSLDRLNRLISERSALLQSAIATKPADKPLVLPNKELMMQIHGVFAAMKEEEERLLSERLKTAAATARRTKFMLVAGDVLALGFLVLAGVVMQGEIKRRRQAEEEQRIAQERYRLLFDTNPLPAWVYELESLAIVDVNRAAIETYGYSREEFCGRSIKDLRPTEDVPAMLASVATAEPQREHQGVWRHRKKDGTVIDVEVTSHPLVYDGNQARIVVAKDITERKRAETEIAQRSAELEAANQELEAFSYSVSHDLRAPLRGIDGFSQALLEDYGPQLDATGQDYLQRIRAGTQRMGTLIDDLLSLSRVTRAELYRGPVDLSALAKQIVAELHAAEPGRSVEVKIAEGLKAQGDGQLLRIALQNLIGNSWKFTGKRTLAEITFGRSGSNGASTYFVGDNGAGFDPTYVKRLFGAFQRLHGTDEFPGTGIGLATVQRIIHRHGGKVWAEGAVGKGATFYFTL